MERKKAGKVLSAKWERYWPWAALWFLFLVYRFAWLNGTSLWIDEGNSQTVSRSLVSALRDRNGAAYFVLLYFWKVLFRDGEFSLRSLSVLIDGVSFVLFIFICREMALSRLQTILAAFLYVVIPPNVVNAQNVRQYVLWNLLQMALWWTLWRATATPTAVGSNTVVARAKTEAVLLWLLCQVFYFLSLESHRYTGVYALGLVLAAGVTTQWNRKLVLLFAPWIVLTVVSSRFFLNIPVSVGYALKASAPLYREWGPLFPLGALIIDPRWNYLLMHPRFHAAVGALAFALFAFGIRHHYRKGHTKESIWLLCLLLPLFVLTLLPLRSYPRLLQPLVPVFCISFAICFVSWLESRSAAVRRSAIVLGSIVVAVFLQTGYKIKRQSLQDFRSGVGSLIDTQLPDTLMIVVPRWACTVARYYSGEESLIMGFPGIAGHTPSLVDALPAFEFIELIALTGHQDDVWEATLNTLGQTHIPTEHWEFAGLEIDRFKRKETVPTVPKSDFFSLFKSREHWNSQCQ